MKNNITKLAKILLLAALLVLGVCLAACETAAAPDSIYFAKEHTPRHSYVRGQELDFTGILLTCAVNGEPVTVPMDSPEVTVSGYDKDKLGAQTVTVTYKEKTTSFQVTVLPRLQVEGYEVNYFVGDSFNKQNGRVKLANDDGTITTVNMRENAVSILNFDSVTPGKKEVTVAYNGYSDTFVVNILQVESVKFSSPTKKTYQSHETEFSVDGGYFTVTSEGGVITKTVSLSKDDASMKISGFDPSLATIENRTAATALQQTVRIEYLGHVAEMKISIRYSGVSIVRQYAAALDGVDHTKPIDDEDGQAAMDAMNEFLELSKADKNLIRAEERDLIVRVSSVYAYDLFLKELAKYAHTFAISEGERTDANNKFLEYCGYFTVSCERYEDMMEALPVLKDKKSTLNTLAAFLRTIEAEFGSLQITEGVTPDAYFRSLYLEDDCVYVADLFKQMTDIYDELSVVPTVWDKETLKDPLIVAGIEKAYTRITTSNFSYLSYPQFYQMISMWREKNDAYEIIHTHYLYNKTYTGDTENYSSYVWEKIPFPGKLQMLYNGIANGYSLSAYMSNSVRDTTEFMIIYRDVMMLVEEIRAEEDPLYMDIYEEIDFDHLIDGYLISASISNLYAYRHVIGSLRYSPVVMNKIWDGYFALVDMTNEEGIVDLKDPDTVRVLEKLFDDFFCLTPFERYQIICSLYSNYGSLNVEGYAFDFSENLTGSFISLFAYYYAGEDGVLPASTRELFQKVMIATEQYGLRYKQLTAAEGAVEVYLTMMEEIIELYGRLSAADKALFDRYIGVAYTANLDMYYAVKAEAPAIETYPLLQELKDVLDAYYAIMAEIAKDTTAANEKGYFSLLFATYEKACALRSAILTSGDEGMLNAYRTFDYIVLNANDENESNDYHKTLEVVFDLMQISARGYTITVTHEDESKESFAAVEYYTEKGLADFLRESYEVLYKAFCGEASSKEAVLALMQKRHALEGSALGLFYSLNLDACYHSALEVFFADALAEDEAAATLAAKLLEAENAYSAYVSDAENDENKTAFTTAWAAVEEALAALGTANENLDTLQGMYDYYLAIYNAMQEEA